MGLEQATTPACAGLSSRFYSLLVFNYVTLPLVLTPSFFIASISTRIEAKSICSVAPQPTVGMRVENSDLPLLQF